MRTEVVEALARGIEYEFARNGPPENFPRMPDIPGGRYTSQEFFDLEQRDMWSRAWLIAGCQEDLPEAGSYQLWDSLPVPVVLVRDDNGNSRSSAARFGAAGSGSTGIEMRTHWRASWVPRRSR